MGILLPKEKYWELPEDEEVKLKEIGLAEFQDKDEGSIRRAYDKDEEIQAIKKNLKRGVKEMKGHWGYANGRTNIYGTKESFG